MEGGGLALFASLRLQRRLRFCVFLKIALRICTFTLNYKHLKQSLCLLTAH